LPDPAAAAPAGDPAGAVVGQVLPMYFVGDESYSMAGEPIAAVNQGLLDLRDGRRARGAAPDDPGRRGAAQGQRLRAQPGAPGPVERP